MVTAAQVRELIVGYSPEGFAGLVKSACAPATFVEVDKVVRLTEVSDLDVRILGVVKDLPGEGAWGAPLLVADVELKKDLTERSSRVRQFRLAKAALQYVETTPPVVAKGMISQGVFVFHDKQGNFRVSLVTVSVENGKFKWSHVKRQSFYVQADPDANATFIQRMCMSWASLKDIKEVFSVEKLTKEFYNQLYKWYERACDDKRVEYPNDIKTDKDNRDDRNRKHLLRLITRLMFVWFLKQKKLVPEELFDEAKLKTILKDFNPVGKKQHQYYRAILQNLFFATLNSEIEEREFADAPSAKKKGEKPTTKHHGVKTKYRYADEFAISKKAVIDLFHPIPFLNGGLFECLDQENDEGKVMYYDGFSQQELHRDHKTLTWAHVPNDLFFDPEYGIIPLLKRYNFTVEENTPGDADVALDPELLGKVFENLLGAYNPETEEVVRKSTGSFYTPREIVNYMVDESLIAYLDGKTADGDVRKQNSIRALVKNGERPDDEVLCSKLSAAVVSAKVLDPACGSGAFPMGALLKMTEVLRVLNRMPEDANLYKLKLQLIENCIFGSDIQEIAVQISKLRFFISLVCEQKPNWDKPNYGINTLPNLETKFVAANSLIGLKRVDTKVASSMERVQGDMFQPTAYQADLFFDNSNVQKIKDDLWSVRHKHFLAQTRKEKNELRRQDKELRTKLANLGTEFGFAEESTRLMASWDPYNQNVHADFFEPEWMFGVKDGFDIVIGNPPYFRYQESHAGEIKELESMHDLQCAKGGKLNAYKLFLAKSLNAFSAKDGIVVQIFQNSFLADRSATLLRNDVINNRTLLTIDSFPERDNPQTRVFESVKMSVCIVLIQNKKPERNHAFSLYVWPDKFMQNGMVTTFTKHELAVLSPKELTIPSITSEAKPVVLKVFAQKDVALKCLEGELNVSFCKKYFTDNKRNPVILKGAAIQRYYFTYEMSQGKIEYLDEVAYLHDCGKSEKSRHHNQCRIAMQGITGVNDRVRLIMCIVPEGSYLANSCNYILPPRNVDPKYLLGILNSSLMNWYFKSFSTNSNVNGYEVDALPIKMGAEESIIPIVNQVLNAKSGNREADTSDLEAKIDALVYKLYGLTEEEIAVVEQASGSGEKKVKGKGEDEGTKAEKVIEVRPVKTAAKAKRAKKPQFAEEF